MYLVVRISNGGDIRFELMKISMLLQKGFQPIVLCRSPGEKWLLERNVKMHIEQNEECIKLMRDFILENPDLWQEDIHDV